jgi:hypothetical protein
MHFLALIHKYNYLCNIDVDSFLILHIVLVTIIIVFYNSINIIHTVADKKKVGQCFFANVNLLALSMVTMKIFIYLL